MSKKRKQLRSMEVSKNIETLLQDCPALLGWLQQARSHDTLKETPQQQLPAIRIEIHPNAPHQDHTPPGEHVMQVGRGVGGFMSSVTQALGSTKAGHVKQGKEQRRSVLLHLPLNAQEIHSVLSLPGVKSISEADREMRHGRVRHYPDSNGRG